MFNTKFRQQICYSVGVLFTSSLARQGGLAFLVQYSILLLLIGAPLLLLELYLAQRSSLAPVALFRHLWPLLAGLGPAVCLLAALR